MGLYYVASITAYGTEKNPRIHGTVWRCSDVVRLGQITAWSGTRALEVPPVQNPRAWLEAALEQWRQQSGS